MIERSMHWMPPETITINYRLKEAAKSKAETARKKRLGNQTFPNNNKGGGKGGGKGGRGAAADAAADGDAAADAGAAADVHAAADADANCGVGRSGGGRLLCSTIFSKISNEYNDCWWRIWWRNSNRWND